MNPGGMPGGVPDLGQLLAQAQQMQADLDVAQRELAEAEVTGTAGGGLVTATMAGDGTLKALVIDPKAVDPDDTETLADLVVAAVHNASSAARQLQHEKMGPVAGGANDALGGLGLPGLG